jgi:hypothetical protein
MKAQTVSLLLAIAVVAAGVVTRAEEKTTPMAVQQFEALKKLAGDWVEVGKDGKPTDKVVSSFRLTSAGTSVQETLFPGEEKEMITMYHLDGANLVLTHYCSLGNQPRMRAEPGKEANKIAFKFTGATNLKSSDDHHINQATLTIVDKDHFKAEWASCKDRKACHQVTLDLVRKQK